MGPGMFDDLGCMLIFLCVFAVIGIIGSIYGGYELILWLIHHVQIS